MESRRDPCPNCAERMVRYRTERTRAGKREAELEWSICPGCRHVRLDHWSLADPSPELQQTRRTSRPD